MNSIKAGSEILGLPRRYPNQSAADLGGFFFRTENLKIGVVVDLWLVEVTEAIDEGICGSPDIEN